MEPKPKPQNTYELLGREKKVGKLVAHLIHHGFTLVHVLNMEPGDWRTVAMEAGISKEPSVETRRLVIERLAEIAKAKYGETK